MSVSDALEDFLESEDWRDSFLEFLNEKVRGSGTCKECSSGRIEVAPAIVTCPTWDAEEQRWRLNGVTYPFALLTCKSCGHVTFYNAARAGIKKENVRP